MSKPLGFNSYKVILPTLALAVVGMAAMVGVTSNLQRDFDTRSEASDGNCISVSHSLDKTYISRHFAKYSGNGSFGGQKDRDSLEIFQPDSSEQSATLIKYDKKAKDNFIFEIKVRDMQVNGNQGLSSLWFTTTATADDNNGFRVDISKFKDGTAYTSFWGILNNAQVGDAVNSLRKVMKFPITLKVERDGSLVSFSYKENNGSYQKLVSEVDLTDRDLGVYLGASNRSPDFPSNKTTFSDFALRCN